VVPVFIYVFVVVEYRGNCRGYESGYILELCQKRGSSDLVKGLGLINIIRNTSVDVLLVIFFVYY
jgi:hypothetical protein